MSSMSQFAEWIGDIVRYPFTQIGKKITEQVGDNDEYNLITGNGPAGIEKIKNINYQYLVLIVLAALILRGR